MACKESNKDEQQNYTDATIDNDIITIIQGSFYFHVCEIILKIQRPIMMLVIIIIIINIIYLNKRTVFFMLGIPSTVKYFEATKPGFIESINNYIRENRA